MVLWPKNSNNVTSKQVGNVYTVMNECSNREILQPEDPNDVYEEIVVKSIPETKANCPKYCTFKFKKETRMKMAVIAVGFLITVVCFGSGVFIWWTEKYSKSILKMKRSMYCPSAKLMSNADCLLATQCNNRDMCVKTEKCCPSRCKKGRICTTAIAMLSDKQLTGNKKEPERVGNKSINMLGKQMNLAPTFQFDSKKPSEVLDSYDDIIHGDDGVEYYERGETYTHDYNSESGQSGNHGNRDEEYADDAADNFAMGMSMFGW